MGTNSDILILGATGFTGSLITEYLSKHKLFLDGTVKVAVGARSKSKLTALAQEHNLPSNIAQVIVDVSDYSSIEAAVKNTEVVINVVGPFWTYGTPVVKACVLHGKKYVDLTGETAWNRQIIHIFDYTATKTGAIIVPACGFDSLPSDLSMFVANKTLKDFSGGDIETSTTAFRVSGGLSGGTLSTAITIIEDVHPVELKTSSKPFSLSPVRSLQRLAKPRLTYNLPFLPATIGGFFFMSPVNKAVVQRTWGLHQYQLLTSTSQDPDREQKKALVSGPSCNYDEFLVTKTRLQAVILTVGFAVAALSLVFVSPIRWLVKNYGLQPGDGPSKEVQNRGFVHTTNIASSVPAADGSRVHVRTVLKGTGDPGYSFTAVLISECALTLLLTPRKSLPLLAQKGGVLTPMSAMGMGLVERLKTTGRVQVESEIMKVDGNGRVESRKDV